MTTDTDTLVALARAWASMDGKLDKFEADDGSDPTLGYSEGYLADANELLVRSGLAARIKALEADNAALRADNDRLTASLAAEVTESEALRAQLTEARAGEDELREALAQYANPDLYRSHPHGLAFDRRDKSYIAIAALASHDKRKEGR